MITNFKDRLKNLIQYNFLIKVMSLFVATALWVVVMNEENPSIENSINVPISVLNAPSGHKLSYEDSRAKVKVRAPRSYFASVDQSEFKAYVNLLGLEEGTHQVPVTVTMPQGFELIEVDPKEVEVTLDPFVEIQFAPKLQPTGTPMAGFTVGDIQASSRSVGVVGPKSVVETVSQVIGYVDLSGQTQPEFTVQVALTAVNEKGQAVTGARVHPSSIEVDVTMARGLNKKILPVHADLMNDLPADYVISNVSIHPTQMEVTGDEAVLRSLTEILTEKISFANTALTGDLISRTVALKLPQGITAAANPTVVVEITVVRKKAADTAAPSADTSEKKEGN